VTRLIRRSRHDRTDHHPGPDRDVSDAVDQDETAGAGNVLIRIKRDRLIQAKAAIADFVQSQSLGVLLFQGINIDPV